MLKDDYKPQSILTNSHHVPRRRYHPLTYQQGSRDSEKYSHVCKVTQETRTRLWVQFSSSDSLLSPAGTENARRPEGASISSFMGHSLWACDFHVYLVSLYCPTPSPIPLMPTPVCTFLCLRSPNQVGESLFRSPLWSFYCYVLLISPFSLFFLPLLSAFYPPAPTIAILWNLIHVWCFKWLFPFIFNQIF